MNTITEKKIEILSAWVSKIEAIPKGKRGKPALVERCMKYLIRYGVSLRGTASKPHLPNASDIKYSFKNSRPSTSETQHTYMQREGQRIRNGKKKAAKALAIRLTSLPIDEHGFSIRGDHHTLEGLDFLAPAEAARWLATPGTCLALVELERKRVYARSCTWRASTATQKYLVGANEIGTGFAHPVSRDCDTVSQACHWIWNGYDTDHLIARQGDIAVVRANGPKWPSHLPIKHNRDDAAKLVRHPTHPDLPFPGKGERVIVGRRAADIYVAEGHGD